MKALALVVILLLCVGKLSATTPEGESAEDRYTYFEMHLLLMANFLPGKTQAFEDFEKLKKIDEENANFIASFWHMKVRMEHSEMISHESERAIREKFNDIRDTSKIKDEAPELVFESTKFIFIGYYFDHWEDVARTISDSLQIHEKRAAIQASDEARREERLKELREARDEWFERQKKTEDAPRMFTPTLPK